jgi:hypothetical protein
MVIMWHHGWGFFAWWMWAFMLLGTIAFWVFVGYVVRTVLLDRRPRDTGSVEGPVKGWEQPPSSDLHGPFPER